MGFSTSGATVVLFLGFMVSLSIAYPTLEGTVEGVSEARDGSGDRDLDRRNTAISEPNATYNATADTLVVTVNNTGSVTLTVADTDLLVDGELRTGYATSVNGVSGRSLWAPGETLRLNVSDVTNEPSRITVVTEFGITGVATPTVRT